MSCSFCFTSQLSNSSSKSSLRKRAQSQSPKMFPTITKKKKNRGRSSSVFHENPEPTSPKVSCIGQVKVNTKKQGKKMKMLACRYGPSTEKNVMQHSNNQRWVHLPLIISKSFKCFGCNSSCFSSNHDGCCCGGCGGCCGGVLRWMVCLDENETDDPLSKNRRKEVEIVVGGVDDESSVMERVCSRRRSIFDDVEFDDLFNNVGISSNDNDNDGGERVKVSISEPPKNALLLMRCKSNPMKMASLSHSIVQPNNDFVVKNEDVGVIKEDNCVKVERFEVNEEVIEIKDGIIEEIKEESVKLEEGVDELCDDLEIISPNVGVLVVSSEEFEEKFDEDKQEIENREKTEENKSIEKKLDLNNVEETQLKEDLNLADECSIETITVEKLENEIDFDGTLVHVEMEVKEGSKDEECSQTQYHPMTQTLFDSEESTLKPKEEKVEGKEESVVGESRKSIEKEMNKPILPDCLLLMMCEPKLSMEVSKETWVCRTDFLRRLPSRNLAKKANKTEGGDDPSSNSNTNSIKKTKAAAVAAHPPLLPLGQGGRSSIQPGRSSISFPAGRGSMANLIEQKLAKAGVGFEPFVLTRCKSAPLRSVAKYVPPELA